MKKTRKHPRAIRITVARDTVLWPGPFCREGDGIRAARLRKFIIIEPPYPKVGDTLTGYGTVTKVETTGGTVFSVPFPARKAKP